VVVVDRDDDDCQELKQRLEQIAHDAGLRSRSNAGDQPYQVVNRLAIEELEAWYFGDWGAVRAAYPKVSKTIPNQARYRRPDEVTGGTWEAFERILKRAGYFRTGLRKIEAARSIAKHWQPQRNRSHSFQVFLDVMQEIKNS
jgi:integrase